MVKYQARPCRPEAARERRHGRCAERAPLLSGEPNVRYADNSRIGFRLRPYSLRRNLATGRPVKHAPHGKILGNVLDLVLDSGSHEQEVTCLERFTLTIVQEHSPATNDEVNLVLRVWGLLARALRKGKGYIQRATLEDDNGVLARGSWDTCLSLNKTDHPATM